MIRMAAITFASLLLAGAATAQESDGPRLLQLELSPGGNGYAVVLDEDGNEYHCDAKETRDAVDLGPCKPLRLVAPLNPATREARQPSMPTMSPAKRSVMDLFERNRCALDYADLKGALERLGARQQRVIGETIAAMTERGEIADDSIRERAVLKIGDRCS